MDDSIKAVRNRLAGAKRVAVLTGAGVSAESGVPTFRGAGGMWNNFRPEDLANPEAFRRDPALVWQWYAWRRGIVAGAKPNAAHLALAGFEKRAGLSLVTQNVDGLHSLAGSKNVIELHGNIWRTRCTECGSVEITRELPESGLPRCIERGCNGLLRPDIVWFGEALPPLALTRAFQAADEAEVFMAIGTSSVVEPAASLSRRAKHNGALVIEINPERTPFTDAADFSFKDRAALVVPLLLD